ncbi:cop9 signalosome complex subunit 3-like protein [Dermatophagoides farinae]|uniref:COP9 signalosome complex subunit 3 n=1 Tax=Dermatophagoides farinae TaxID=6954 RepID=A0A9D4SKG2_DERFA|nr:COP9 signalosome complex subunit 3-like [Dermatophagoides farinae]KAH7644350.1 cop9 signalosome complex subunit 3-like protein [Dermatophagoides farinae]
MSTDKLLAIIRSHSLQGQYTQMADYIFGDIAFKNSLIVDELIRNLDIQENTVAILYLLCRQQTNQQNNLNGSGGGVNASSSSSTTTASSSNKNNNNNTANPTKSSSSSRQSISQIIEFINDCNENQIKQAPNHFASLCHSLTEYLMEIDQPLKGLEPLSRSIQKVQQSPTQLTSIHTDLCKLALIGKCLKPALTFLDIDITDISRENDCYDVKYFLSYYYYGGIIYSIIQNYERAFLFFQTVLSVTGAAISQISIEAYKKYILVSLLQNGRVIPLMAKQVNNYLNRSVKPFCGPYNMLITEYTNGSIESLNDLLDTYRKDFQDDQNIGLVKQVISSLVKVKMQKLTKTFMTLSLKDMAQRVHLPNVEEAEKKILHMIENGEIFAQINQKDGMVEFHDNPEKYDSLQMYKMIEEQINKCMCLNEKLKTLDQDIAINPKYIQKMRNNDGDLV